MLAERKRHLLESMDDLKRNIDRLAETNEATHMLVISSAFSALKRCQEAEGLSPSARQQVKSALRMCEAALGL